MWVSCASKSHISAVGWNIESKQKLFFKTYILVFTEYVCIKNYAKIHDFILRQTIRWYEYFVDLIVELFWKFDMFGRSASITWWIKGLMPNIICVHVFV